MYKGYLIDLDGTAFKGQEVILSARNVINRWIYEGKSVLFVTNNASKSINDVARKLINMGYDITKEMIYTSALATRDYLKDQSFKSCYIIGEDCLKNEISLTRNENPDLVIVGYTNKIDYDMLTKACVFINNGAKLIGTNPDRAIPCEGSNIPGNGSIVKLLEYATNTEALFIGKPSTIMMEYAIKKIGLEKSELCMIGDNYETDIMSGINSLIDTVFVNTGLTSIKEVKKQEILPTYICETLEDFIKIKILRGVL